MNYIGIIPARYASTRFPGKPLAVIGGKSMIQRVYEQALKANLLSYVVVATDDNRIKKHVQSFGGKVIMTSHLHKSGTERCNEVIEILKEKYDVVVNIQGDEPFINPGQIDKLVSCFSEKNVEIATLVKKIDSSSELFNTNVVKAIINHEKQAIYFSRNPIPYYRGKEQNVWKENHEYYKHIGIYAYKTETLKVITKLKQSPLEIAESLEQLRWIENGIKIKIEFTNIDIVGIDTPEDIFTLNDSLNL